MRHRLFPVKLLLLLVFLLNSFNVFAEVSADAGISAEKISFSNVSSYMVSAGTEVRFSKENRYAVAQLKYLYPIYDLNRFNGIPQSIEVSVGFGKNYLLNTENTEVDADLRLSFINLGIDRVNLYSLIEVCGTLRHRIENIELLVPVTCSISVNGYSFGIGIGVQHTWEN